MDTNALLRTLPKTDEVLAAPELAELLRTLPRPLVLDAVRGAVDDVRADGGRAAILALYPVHKSVRYALLERV